MKKFAIVSLVLSLAAPFAGAQSLSDLAPKSGCALPLKNEACPKPYPKWQGPSPSASLYVGRENVWMGAPDLYFRNDHRYEGGKGPMDSDGTPKLYARALYLADIGDASDLGLRRAGPDGATPFSKPAPLGPNVNIGTLYWQAWGGRCDGEEGWWSGCRHTGRNAQIYSRTVDKQTGESRAGQITIATTPKGNPGDPVDRVAISDSGQFLFFENGTATLPNIASQDNSRTGIYLGKKQIGFTSGGTTVLELSGENLRDNSTGLLLRVGRADRKELVPVEIGPENSCGTGYRCLRVKN